MELKQERMQKKKDGKIEMGGSGKDGALRKGKRVQEGRRLNIKMVRVFPAGELPEERKLQGAACRSLGPTKRSCTGPLVLNRTSASGF